MVAALQDISDENLVSELPRPPRKGSEGRGSKQISNEKKIGSSSIEAPEIFGPYKTGIMTLADLKPHIGRLCRRRNLEAFLVLEGLGSSVGSSLVQVSTSILSHGKSRQSFFPIRMIEAASNGAQLATPPWSSGDSSCLRRIDSGGCSDDWVRSACSSRNFWQADV